MVELNVLNCRSLVKDISEVLKARLEPKDHENVNWNCDEVNGHLKSMCV
jgi:hypothetical protein